MLFNYSGCLVATGGGAELPRLPNSKSRKAPRNGRCASSARSGRKKQPGPRRAFWRCFELTPLVAKRPGSVTVALGPGASQSQQKGGSHWMTS
eukprot:5124279-Amphidinium_carterae.3